MGFALIFANNPFARIFTAATGHGDEVSAFNHFPGNYTAAWFAGPALVLLLTPYSLHKVFGTTGNNKRAGYFLLFLLTPMLADFGLLFKFMNTVLKEGFMSHCWILGSPVRVTLFTALSLRVFVCAGKHIYRLFK